MKITIFLLLLFSSSILGGGFCPEEIQSILIVKTFAYIREMANLPKAEFRIGVINGGKIVDFIQEAAAESSEKISVKSIKMDSLNTINVVYIPKGTDPEIIRKIKAVSRDLKILSIAGDPIFVNDYNLSLAIHLIEGKPRIYINYASAEEEGTKFSAVLLKLADKK